MNIDNNFSIKEFLLSNGFDQTRDSDKRDNFKKTYFDPWSKKTKRFLSLFTTTMDPITTRRTPVMSCRYIPRKILSQHPTT